MTTIKTFEDLEIWQLARKLSNQVYRIISYDAFAKDFGLKNQINSSSGSVMDNIAEGFERDGTKEFIQFLSIAKASCGECRSQLYRAYDRSYISQEELDSLSAETKDLGRKIGNLITYLKKSGYRGKKYEQPKQQ